MVVTATRGFRMAGAGPLRVAIGALIVALSLSMTAEASAQSASAAGPGDPEIVSIWISPATVDVHTGFATFSVEVALKDDDGLAEHIQPRSIDAPSAVYARSSSDLRYVAWPTLRRVSGTANDGVWWGQVEVSPYWAGAQYRVTNLQLKRLDGEQIGINVEDGPTFAVGGQPNWAAVVDRTPVRVVYGTELWTPRLWVLDRATGAGVGGAGLDRWDTFRGPPPSRRVTPPSLWTAPDGSWTASSRSVRDDLDQGFRYLAYGRRGTRGWSLEAETCLGPTVKAQANSRYSATTLAVGSTLTVTGNAWPAPAIHHLGSGNIHLQRAVGDGSWEIVATSQVRHNGRYTLTWTPVTPGDEILRVRKPGVTYTCAGSVGTNLVGVAVTIR